MGTAKPRPPGVGGEAGTQGDSLAELGKGEKKSRNRWGAGMGRDQASLFLLGLLADGAGKLLLLAPAQLPHPCNGLILKSAKK